MTSQLEFDAAVSRHLESLYVSAIPATRRQKALAALDLRPGEHVLDVGTGPGYLAGEMALQLGSAGQIVGIDKSPDMLSRAKRRCAGLPQVSFQEADVTKIPSAPEAFDAAAAIQVYEFVEDMEAALRELHRVLRPGGRAIIVDIDLGSLVWEAGDRARAARVFHARDQADPYLPRRLGPLLRQAGFDLLSVDTYALVALTAEPFVAGMAKFAAGFVAGRRGVTAEDAAAWLDDLAAMDAGNRYFFSVTMFLFLTRRRPG